VDFAIAGSHSYNVPIAGYYLIECVGGGGGGGHKERWPAGGGGGGGAYVSGFMYLTAAQVVSITVGASGSGVAGESSEDGAPGGASFVTISGSERMRANGGAGGQGTYGGFGGAGGTGSAQSSVEFQRIFSGGRGGHASLVGYRDQYGGGGGSAGNSLGQGHDGRSPSGASAQSGKLMLGAGGRGFSGPDFPILPTSGGVGAGGGGGHAEGSGSGGPGFVRITSVSNCSGIRSND
jgi:hypothetical protein